MSEVFGIKGSRLPKEAIVVLANSKVKEFERLISMIESGAPVTLSPRVEEAEFAVNLYRKVLGKKPDEEAIRRGFAKLPSSIGKVTVIDTSLMIHFGLAYNKRTVGDKVLDVMGVRSKYAKKGGWEDLIDHLRRRRDEIPKDGTKVLDWVGLDHDVTNKHMARIVCPGWGLVGSEEHHDCGVDRIEREPWHKLRCPECHKAFMKARGTYRGGVEGVADIDSVLDEILG